MAEYRPPAKRVHRGFFYLNDETVINSLSAVEAGKVDEVLAKVNRAREGSMGGAVDVSPIKVEAGRKSTSEIEEEMVRKRTRFSVFESWYQTLVQAKALGRFEGWGPEILKGVQPGDTVEFTAELELAPLPTVFRMFFWFAQQAKETSGPFSQKGEELKVTKDNERLMRLLAGRYAEEELLVLAKPTGDMGPPVAMRLSAEWLIGKIGNLSGTYTVVGQVDQVLSPDESVPALRLSGDFPPTSVELEVWQGAVGNFTEPAQALGLDVSSEDAAIAGPALWLSPAAIYR